MKTVELIELEDILEINKEVCAVVRQKSVCMDRDKIESALGAAFYPGNYPFYHGGIPRVAGALCFFLIKAHAFMDANKRTAALAATMFMDLNGYELRYPLNVIGGVTAFTNVIEKAAASEITKDELIEWFDEHKKSLVAPKITKVHDDSGQAYEVRALDGGLMVKSE
jgi:death-on-curing family protein